MVFIAKLIVVGFVFGGIGGLVTIKAMRWLFRDTVDELVDRPVDAAAHRALADELAAVTRERDLLRRQLAAVEE